MFLSDHGEQFREHHALYHNHSLYEEELRIPGWILAGANGLSASERAALGTYAGTRTYTHDVHATIVDLLGLHGQEGKLPFAREVVGRFAPSTARRRSDDAPRDLDGGVGADGRALRRAPRRARAHQHLAHELELLPARPRPEAEEPAARRFAAETWSLSRQRSFGATDASALH